MYCKIKGRTVGRRRANINSTFNTHPLISNIFMPVSNIFFQFSINIFLSKDHLWHCSEAAVIIIFFFFSRWTFLRWVRLSWLLTYFLKFNSYLVGLPEVYRKEKYHLHCCVYPFHRYLTFLSIVDGLCFSLTTTTMIFHLLSLIFIHIHNFFIDMFYQIFKNRRHILKEINATV